MTNGLGLSYRPTAPPPPPPPLEVLDAAKYISIDLFRLSQGHGPPPVSSWVLFSGSWTFTGSIYGSFQEPRTSHRFFSRFFLKVKKLPNDSIFRVFF